MRYVNILVDQAVEAECSEKLKADLSMPFIIPCNIFKNVNLFKYKHNGHVT